MMGGAEACAVNGLEGGTSELQDGWGGLEGHTSAISTGNECLDREAEMSDHDLRDRRRIVTALQKKSRLQIRQSEFGGHV